MASTGRLRTPRRAIHERIGGGASVVRGDVTAAMGLPDLTQGRFPSPSTTNPEPPTPEPTSTTSTPPSLTPRETGANPLAMIGSLLVEDPQLAGLRGIVEKGLSVPLTQLGKLPQSVPGWAVQVLALLLAGVLVLVAAKCLAPNYPPTSPLSMGNGGGFPLPVFVTPYPPNVLLAAPNSRSDAAHSAAAVGPPPSAATTPDQFGLMPPSGPLTKSASGTTSDPNGVPGEQTASAPEPLAVIPTEYPSTGYADFVAMRPTSPLENLSPPVAAETGPPPLELPRPIATLDGKIEP